MGPATVAALQQLLRDLSDDPAGLLIAATTPTSPVAVMPFA